MQGFTPKDGAGGSLAGLGSDGALRRLPDLHPQSQSPSPSVKASSQLCTYAKLYPSDRTFRDRKAFLEAEGVVFPSQLGKAVQVEHIRLTLG